VSEPIRSTRTLGETTHTYAYPRHEDKTRVSVADVAYVDVYAHSIGRQEAMWVLFNQPTADFLSDTASSWPIDSIGYTFHHALAYGSGQLPFTPRGGQRVTLTYTLWRTGNRGPIIIKHIVTYESNQGFEELAIPST